MGGFRGRREEVGMGVLCCKGRREEVVMGAVGGGCYGGL